MNQYTSAKFRVFQTGLHCLSVASLTVLLSACGGSSGSSDKSADTAEAITATSDNFVATYAAIGATQQGRSQFTLRIKDHSGNAVAGEAVSLMPMMAMLNGMHHSSPHEGCTNTNDVGESVCTVYYLMPSEMNGEPMGTWSLSVTVQGESLEFSPLVSMPMSTDTVRAVLKGQNGGMDVIPTMTMSAPMDNESAEGMSAMSARDMANAESEVRTYYLFNDGVSSTETGHSLRLFVAAKNSMTSFPAVATDGMLMNGDTMVMLDTVFLDVSSDDGATWIQATEAEPGHFTATNLQGLTDSAEAQLKVRLTINDEQKTVDGMMLSESNGAATFFVTP